MRTRAEMRAEIEAVANEYKSAPSLSMLVVSRGKVRRIAAAAATAGIVVAGRKAEAAALATFDSFTRSL